MKPKIAVRAANKIRSNTSTQNLARKRRLIVKLGKNDISEDLSVPMASKVCMVCKTFKSSSNTTLNAHMDQCLSGVSTSVKRTVDPKVIKHRIKPRKTRLIVDIYETAVPCTLEDLNRRNGTNWSSNLGFQAQENNDINNNNKNNFMSISEEKKEEEGAVYIDSNGTKVRILSKLSDVKFNSNGEGDDCTKLLKDDLQTKTNNNDSGMIKPKVNFKRTGHKTPDHKSDRHPNITHNARITTRLHPLDNNLLSASECDRTSNENVSDASYSSGDEYVPEQQQQEQSCLTNRACFYFSDSLGNKKKDRKMLSSRNFKRIKENRSTVNVDRRPIISSRGKKLSTLTCLGSRKRLSGFKKPAIRMRNKKQGKIDETRVEKESRLLNNTALSSETDSHVSFIGHIMPAGTLDPVEISYESGREELPLVAFVVNVSKVEGNYCVNVDPIPIPETLPCRLW